MQALLERGEPHHAEYRLRRPNGEVRWCVSTAAASLDAAGKVQRICGVTMDITERKEAEERQAMLAREVDHRAKNAMAIVQSIVRLTKAANIASYVSIIEGRIKALSRAHALLSNSRWQGADLENLVHEELAPYRSTQPDRLTIFGPKVLLEPTTSQTLALALHELADQRGEIRRALLRGRQAQPALGDQGRQPDHPLAGDRGAGNAQADRHRLRHADHHRAASSASSAARPSSSGCPTGLRCTLTMPCGERLSGRETRSRRRRPRPRRRPPCRRAA